MSVYIKGMEMPTSPELFCIHPDGKVFADLEGGWREYKAVPVPDHGRLIDANALIGKLHDECLFDYDARSVVYADIQDAPTIIPSDLPVMYYPQVDGITPTIIPADKEGEG